MCGIAGYTHVAHSFVAERISDAVASIVHRGPDDQSSWQSESASLGAARLRVIDLTAGAQPVFSDNKDFVLVFNGEIYNHTALRRQLITRGHNFRSSCDTEVVLRAFMEWDTGCLSRLDGMFAFAVWQESSKKLVLARDRMGIKPLYYTQHGGDIYFGSEIKSLFCHPEVKRKLDLSGLDSFLAMNYIPEQRTLVDGVRKLMPGSFLTWHNGEISMRRYWDVRDAETTSHRSIDDSAAELDYLLSRSVKSHLEANVPVGVWLSGGLDSSTILHYASQWSTTPPRTFSITFNGREFDEAPYLRSVAQRYGTEHFELDLGPKVVTDSSVAELAYYADEPNADAGAVPVWHLSKLSAQHVTVALSGEGADELFGGYITYLADTYAQKARLIPRWLRELSLQLSQQLRASNRKIGLDYKIQRFLQGTLMDERSSHIFWNGAFSRSQRRRMLRSYDGTHLNELLSTIPKSGDVRRFLEFDRTFYLSDNLLAKVDRMSMAHALEVRPAFLDHRIVEFAASLPANYCIRGSNLKFLLRHLMKNKLPKSVLEKKKQGLDIPVHDWLRGHLKTLLMDTVNEKAVKETGFLHWPHVESLLQMHMERKINYGYHLWGMLMLFLWVRQWNIECNEEMQATQGLASGTFCGPASYR